MTGKDKLRAELRRAEPHRADLEKKADSGDVLATAILLMLDRAEDLIVATDTSA